MLTLEERKSLKEAAEEGQLLYSRVEWGIAGLL